MTAVLETQEAAPGSVGHVTVDRWATLTRCAGFTNPVTITDAAWRDAGMADRPRRFQVLHLAYLTAYYEARGLMDADEQLNRACYLDESPILSPLFRDGETRTLLCSVPSDGQHRPTLLLITANSDPAPSFVVSLFGEGAA